MRFFTFVAAAVGVMAVSSTFAIAADAENPPWNETGGQAVAQQCLKDLQAFDEKLAQIGFGVLPPDGYGVSAPSGYYIWGVEGKGTPRQKLRSLRKAAYVYAREANEQLCQTVLASMRHVYDRHQKLVGIEAYDPNVRMAWRRAHISRAKPVTQMNHLMRADVIIGSEIRNLKDEKLGEIEDLVLDPEKQNVLYVLASRGGFLGFGKKLLAVRWSDLRATEDHKLYVLDVSAKALEDAPEVDCRNFEKTADADWRRLLSVYWDGILKP
jgi:sporulation protein YlmC with PRC-barrel domain